jgi:membrane protease YdiL (CAAX protease family)
MADTGVVRRSPILTYVVLAYLLPLPILLLRFFDLPFEPLLVYAAWTPNIAAFLVLGLVLREPGGIRKLLAGWGKWRVGAVWYVVALSPLFVAFLTVALLRLLGGATTPPQPPVVVQLLSFLVFSIVTGAMGEELGWRGFLLPRLQQRFNALTSSLTVGVI